MAEQFPETRRYKQLPRATAISPQALIAFEEEEGPLQAIELKRLLGRLIQTDTVKETRADLLADLDHDDASVALVFADPDPAQNGWYRKAGAVDEGTWLQFEKLSDMAAAEIAEYVDSAAASAAAALAAAGVNEYASASAGIDGTSEGETFWVDSGDGTGTTYRHDAGPIATAIGKFIKDPTGAGAAGILGVAGGGNVQQALDAKDTAFADIAARAIPAGVGRIGLSDRMQRELIETADDDPDLLPEGEGLWWTRSNAGARYWKYRHANLSIEDLADFDDGDDLTAEVSALAKLAASTTTSYLVGLDKFATKTIILPPRHFKLKAEALMSSATANKAAGLRIIGAGIMQTSIEFDPDEAGEYLFYNNNSWLFVDVEGISFYSASADNHFYRAHNDNPPGAVQSFAFRRCAWRGNWGDVFHLTGNNNNSEYSFERCHASGLFTRFLYVDANGGATTDQLLNYWFDKCTIWASSTDGDSNLITMEKGGSIRLTGNDFSGWQRGTIYKLIGGSHSNGVENFSAIGNRYELKSANVKVMECSWGRGAVSFRDEDWSSQATFVSSATVHWIFTLTNAGGPSILFDNCRLMGRMQFAHGTNNFEYKASVRFINGTTHEQFYDFFDLFDMAETTNPRGLPSIEVEGSCRGRSFAVLSFTAWAPSTSYSVGDRRRNGPAVYECITAGASAASGGPTGKGSDIVDGAAHWKYIANDSRDYITATAFQVNKRAVPKAQRRLAMFGPNFPYDAAKVRELILPPHVILTASLMHSDAADSASGAYADFRLTQGVAAPVTLVNNDTTPHSAGFDQAGAHHIRIAADLDSRTIQLVAGANGHAVDAPNTKAEAWVEYIG